MIRPPPTSTLFPDTTLFRSPPPPGVRPRLPRQDAVLRPGRRGGHGRRRAGVGVRRPLQPVPRGRRGGRSEEHTSELQSRQYIVCCLLLEKKNTSPHPPFLLS